MTTRELIDLVMKSSNTCPYRGELSEKETILGAIELAKLSKSFADKGQTGEAMDVPSEQWVEVIGKLEESLSKLTV